MNEGRRRPHVRLAPADALAAIGAGVLGTGFWVGMTALFHLVFHLQPAIIGALAGWTLRWRAGPGLSRTRTVVVAATSAAGVVGGAAAIAALGGGADPVPFTVAVGVGGTITGLWLLARPRAADRPASPAPGPGGPRAEGAERA
jgi:hypothetical protein